MHRIRTFQQRVSEQQNSPDKKLWSSCWNFPSPGRIDSQLRAATGSASSSACTRIGPLVVSSASQCAVADRSNRKILALRRLRPSPVRVLPSHIRTSLARNVRQRVHGSPSSTSHLKPYMRPCACPSIPEGAANSARCDKSRQAE